MLRFQTFGTIDLREEGGERRDELLDQPKRLALLAVLATHQPAGPVRREKLISLLWPESAPSSARTALSTTLSRLRDTLGEEALRGRGEESIALAEEHVRSDVAAFQRACDEERHRETVELYAGPFLEGFRPPDARPFEEWVARRRDEYGQRGYRAAIEAAREARDTEQWGVAEASLRTALEIEPLREEAAQELMNLFVDRGDRASALQVYEDFRERLGVELGLSPSEGMSEAARQLRSEAAAGGRDGSTPPSRGDRQRDVLAVLPFEPLGREGASTLCEGMHDALLTRLSNISGVGVISRTSVQQYRRTDKTTAEIAHELGVSWILKGGVQEMEDQIQVNAQLVDPESDTHVWADSYRRDLTAEQLFTLQSEITKKIARSLEAELTSEEQKRVEHLPTRDLAAYRLYAQGKAQLAQRTETGMRSALRAFEQAIEHDSTYAPAWSGMADARTLLWDSGFASSDDSLEQARIAGQRALSLNSSLAEGHASLALVEAFQNHDGARALQLLERAKELKPSYAQAHLWSGYIRAAVGKLESSIAHLERASELDPTAPVVAAALAHGHLMARQLEEAMRQARRARELAPEYAAAHLFEGQVLASLGRPEEAATAIDRGLSHADRRVRRRHLRFRAWMSMASARAGSVERARELLRQIAECSDHFAEGIARLALGETDLAFAAFSRTEWTPLHAMNARFHPALDPLRDSPRFHDLLEEIDRDWGLQPDRRLPSDATSLGSSQTRT